MGYQPVSDPPAIAVVRTEGRVEVIIWHGDGSIDQHPVRRAGPGVALRFAAGEPGRRGTVWRLWANRNTNDVYVASRHTAAEFKVSFHASGDWRVQIVQPDQPKSIHIRDLVGDQSGRILFQWRRPAPDDAGWTYGISIVLPDGHLVDTPVDQWEDVQWHIPPGEDEQVEFVICLVKPDNGTVMYGKLFRELHAHLAYLDALELASGEVALVVALRLKTPEDEALYIERLEELSEETAIEAPPFDASIGPRILVMGANEVREPRFYDLVHRPE